MLYKSLTHCTNICFNFLGMLVRALESDWGALSEELGLWIPVEVANEVHDDKPEGVEELGNSVSSQNAFSPSYFCILSLYPYSSLTVIKSSL